MRNAKEMAKFLRDTEGYHATKVCSSDLMECAGILEAQQQEIERQKKRVDEYSKDYGAAVEIIAEKNQKIEQYKIALDGKEFANNNLFKLNQQLIQENEQLQAQNGVYREEIRQRLHGLSYQSSEWSHGEHPRVVDVEDIDDMLDEFDGRSTSTDNTTYHNPADVEALAKAREALEKVLDNLACMLPVDDYWANKHGAEAQKTVEEALEQIDKAGGGEK